jgi:ADP-L-glycero-D-manno-heptose 6-epimerase
MIVVTGGSGFIGSNVAAALAARGDRVAVVDWLGQGDKWRNIAKHPLDDFVTPDQLDAWLADNISAITAVVHLGAISATTETDADLIVRSNFQLSLKLWRLAAKYGWTFIYASSAATYGDGEAGFDDAFDAAALSKLRPLNPYGWSKHLFDRRVLAATLRGEPAPPQWAGLKFFNVYGPNEYHKGSMRSVVAANYAAVAAAEPLRLFKSYRAGYDDGGQQRDFVYVKDCVGVVLWMLGAAFRSDVYNVGSGVARSWLDLGRAMFAAAALPERIDFIEMPMALRERYQYFTQAKLEKLRAAGYSAPFASLEDGIRDYVHNYLSSADPYR